MYVYKTRGTCSKAIEIELDGDAVKSAVKNFSFENFYLVPKGGAFFIDAGILADAKYGPAVFVVELDKKD